MNKNIYSFKEFIEKSGLKKALFFIIMIFFLTANIQAQTASENTVIKNFPYLEEFTNGSSSLAAWTIIDANGDGDAYPNYPNGKWTFRQDAAKYTFSNNDLPADDWLISPKVKISGNLAITFKHKVQKNNIEEKFSVYIITGNSPKNLENANKILDTKSNTSSEYQTIDAISIPSTYNNQEVYIGIKCESNKYGMGLYIDDFKIEAQETGTFALTASVINGVGGEITPTNISVNPGAEQVFIIKPADNYTIDKLTDNNIDKTPVYVESNNTYTYTVSNINEEHIISVKFKLHNPSGITYTLTAAVNEDGNGGISPDNVIVEPGKDQTFTITPNEGYEIYKLMDTGDDKTNQVTNNKYVLTEITKDHNIIVSFKIKTHNLKATVEEPNTGTISPDDINIAHGYNQVFNIIPAQGYSLESLKDNEVNKISDVSEGGVYTIHNVDKAHTIVAKFKLTGTPANTHSVQAIVVDGHGTVEPNTPTIVQTGANQKFIIKPAIGYEIESLTDNDDIKTEEIAKEQQYIEINIDGNINYIPNGTADVYNLNNIQGDHTIFVRFKQEGTTPTPPSTKTFGLAANIKGGNGKISPRTSSVEAGGEETFTIIPDTGYELDSLIDNKYDKTSDVTNGKYKLTDIQSDHIIVVSFKKTETPSPTTFDLSASVDGIGGSISPTSQTANAGSDFEFTITPDEGYILDNLKDNNTGKTDKVVDGKYKLEYIQEIHTIVVKFKKTETPSPTTFDLSASVDGIGGSISPTSQTANAGSDFEFTITPDQGYILDNLKDNDTGKTDKVVDGKYKLEKIQDNHTIVVKFKKNTSILENSSIELSIYPNPTTDYLNILAPKQISKIQIITINGKTIDTQTVNNYNYQYETSTLTEGNYLIRIYIDNETILKQFSVIR